ncbi:hypothetical protein D3C85_1673530 [compost metagenome]
MLAMAVSSCAEICEAMAEACIISRNWPVSAGYTFSMEGCSITCQPMRQRDSPRHSAASICPRGTASSPARMISAA